MSLTRSIGLNVGAKALSPKLIRVQKVLYVSAKDILKRNPFELICNDRTLQMVFFTA